jgi:hypothetical protein
MASQIATAHSEKPFRPLQLPDGHVSSATTNSTQQKAKNVHVQMKAQRSYSGCNVDADTHWIYFEYTIEDKYMSNSAWNINISWLKFRLPKTIQSSYKPNK